MDRGPEVEEKETNPLDHNNEERDVGAQFDSGEVICRVTQGVVDFREGSPALKWKIRGKWAFLAIGTKECQLNYWCHMRSTALSDLS
jgi:hypothetical protein